MRLLGVHDCVLGSLVWVGSDLIILAKECASLKIVVIALELVPTSKRLLGNNTPQGNTELPRSWVVLVNVSPTKSYLIGIGLSIMQPKRNGLTIRLGLGDVPRDCLGQGPRPNGPEIMSHTISLYHLSNIKILLKITKSELT